MADIALIFHWPPSVMDEMYLEDLMEWHSKAVERHNAMHSEK